MVEDETSITEPLAEALDREGFATRVAGTVADALRAAERRDAGPRPPRRDAPGRLRLRRRPARSASAPRSRSSCSPPAARRPTASSASSSAPTTTSSSPSARARWPRGFARCCAADGRRPGGEPRPSRARSRSARSGSTRPAARPALGGDELDLTRKEFELLQLLMSEAGAVISRERLIDEVWDVNWFGSTKTLDVHVSSLRRKLGDDSAEPALHPHRPRRGLPLRLRRGAMSLRARLVARVRVRPRARHRRARGAAGAQPVEAGRRRDQERGPQPDRAGRRRRQQPAERRAPAHAARRALGTTLGGRVIVVDARGRVLADCLHRHDGGRRLQQPARDPQPR